MVTQLSPLRIRYLELGVQNPAKLPTKTQLLQGNGCVRLRSALFLSRQRTHMLKTNKFKLTLLTLLSLYVLGYGIARVTVLQAVEHYAGPEGKSFPRQDYIAKRDQSPGEGWEYQLFVPLIKLEETMMYFFHNLRF